MTCGRGPAITACTRRFHSLDSYGNPLRTPGCQGEGEGHLVGSQGTVHHEAGGTQNHRPGHGTQPSGASQPGDHDEDHPGRGHRRGREARYKGSLYKDTPMGGRSRRRTTTTTPQADPAVIPYVPDESEQSWDMISGPGVRRR